MTRASTSFVAAIAAVSAGCTTPRWEEPKEGVSSARLRVVLQGDNSTLVKRLQNACIATGNHRRISESYDVVAGFERRGMNSSLRKLGMPDPPSDETRFTEVRIEASRPFLLGYESNQFVSGALQSSVHYCMGGLSFTPEVNADYEAVIVSPETMACQIVMRRLVTSGGQVIRQQAPHVSRISEKC